MWPERITNANFNGTSPFLMMRKDLTLGNIIVASENQSEIWNYFSYIRLIVEMKSPNIKKICLIIITME